MGYNIPQHTAKVTKIQFGAGSSVNAVCAHSHMKVTQKGIQRPRGHAKGIHGKRSEDAGVADEQLWFYPFNLPVSLEKLHSLLLYLTPTLKTQGVIIDAHFQMLQLNKKLV